MLNNMKNKEVNNEAFRRIKQLKRALSVTLSVVQTGTMIHSAVPVLVSRADGEAHTHSWTYAASGASITATCTEGCEGGYDTSGITVTINASDSTYTGSEKTANITGYSGEAVAELAEVPTTITYYVSTGASSTETSGEALEGAPVNAGNYVAEMTWGGETAKVAFSITKADQAQPAAPTSAGATLNSITLEALAGGEYKCGEGGWQDSTVFSGLTPDTEYTFYQRLKGDDNHNASPASEGTTIRTTAHTHSFAYTADGNAITAKCTEDCTVGSYYTSGITITVDASNSTYSGTPITATVTGYPGTAVSGLAANPSVTYYNATEAGSTTVDGEALAGAPTDAGNYVAKITWGDKEASKAFSITPKAATITAKAQTIAYGTSISTELSEIEDSGFIEGDTVFSVTLTPSTAEVTTEGTITPSAAVIKRSGTEVTNNYAITYTDGNLTITADSMTVTASEYSGTYDSAAHGITVTAPEGATVKYGTAEDSCTSETNITYTNVGTYTVYYEVTKANYTTVTGSKTITITAKALTITANDQSITHGTDISALVSDVTVEGLEGEDALDSITLIPSTAAVTTTGTITPSAPVIKNGGNTVTDNYNITYNTGNLTITAASMEVSATGFNGTYDGSAHGITVTGPEGSTVSYGTVSGNYDLDASPEYTDAGTYTVYYKVEKENCDPVTGSANVVIAKAGISPSVTLEGWTYGETANTPSVTGNEGSGTVNYEYYTDNACTEPVDGVPSNAGTYYVKAIIGETANYESDYATAEFTIEKMAVTITAANQEKVYGTSISEGVSYVTDPGLATGDTLTAVDLSSDTPGTITPSNAVIKKGEVDVTNNYIITYNNGTLTLTPVAITIKAIDQTVASGSTLATGTDKVTVSVGSLVAGDSIAAITLAPAGAITAEGNIIPSGARIENAAGENVTANYTITYDETGTITVTLEAATLTTPPTAKENLKYTGEAQVLINPGEASGGTLKYGLTEAGTYGEISTITGTDAGTYTVWYKVEGDANHSDIAATSLTVTIGKMDAPADIDDTNKPTAKTGLEYTASAQALLNAPATSLEGYTVKYLLEGESEYSTTIPTGTEVGSYTISVKYFGDANHADFELTGGLTAAIGTRDLTGDVTIELDENTFAFGSTPISPTATVRITSAGRLLSASTDYDIRYEGVSPTTYVRSSVAPTTPGTYNIVAVFKGNYTGEASEGYEITMQSSAPVAQNRTITYDGSTYNCNQLFEFIYAADVVGRTFSIVTDGSTGAGTIEGSTLTITKAGTIKVQVVTAATETVASSTVISTLTVNKGTATGTITVADVSYGNPVADPTTTADPVAAGVTTIEYRTGSGSWSTTKPIAAGSYQARATIGGGDLYEATIVTTTFKIDKATLTVSADNKSKARDEADPALTYSAVSGLASGDTLSAVLTGSLTREAGEDVGTYAITQGTLAIQGSNYELTFTPGTFTITKATHADITVPAANAVSVPTIASENLTVDVKNFISPAPSAGTTYALASASGIVKTTSPAPSVNGSTVIFAVSASEDNADGSIVVNVSDPNYDTYSVTVPIKSSDSIKYKAETELTGSAAGNTVSSVFSGNLDDCAQALSNSSTAVILKLDVTKKSASDVSAADVTGILSDASGYFVGYTTDELTGAYLEIDVTQFTDSSLGAIDTSTGGEGVHMTQSVLEIALVVGTDVTNKNPVVVRVHDGTRKVFASLTSRPSGSYSDGTVYVDKTQGIIYLYTQRFSLYSFVYASTTPCTVTFDPAGGSSVGSYAVKSGSKITKPSDPSRSGYSFGGWYNGDTVYDFDSNVTGNITLTAHWNAASSGNQSSGKKFSYGVSSVDNSNATAAAMQASKPAASGKKKAIITVVPIEKGTEKETQKAESLITPGPGTGAYGEPKDKSKKDEKDEKEVLKEEKLFDGSYEINTESLSSDKSIVLWLAVGIAIGIVAMGIIMMIVLKQLIFKEDSDQSEALQTIR
ncbi:Listeria/Bacterioides repeat-containing protein [Lachnospiraceae bacterium YSD2013]|nr:Listeria/Bacterioides repeat-containing protein [Lachnospiraceae bacterium YSD2013]